MVRTELMKTVMVLCFVLVTAFPCQAQNDFVHTKTVKQTIQFKAGTHEIYEMLMDSKKHSEFTGLPAEIGRTVGSTISAYNGIVEGFNIELEQDKRIVQKWRHDAWPVEHYSIATFDLLDSVEGTTLIFTHQGVPLDRYNQIYRGWHSQYWNKMRAFIQGEALSSTAEE